MNKNFNLTIGLNDKDSRKQELTFNDAKHLLAKVCIFDFKIEGLTIQAGDGVYKYIDNQLIFEESIVLILKAVDETIINPLVEALKTAFNQEAIMVEEVISKISFI